ncbi:cytokinesis regulator protein [Sporothrix brasiliensis 5110]|uniref:Cytokinesis regulator protein n=1 Tax=Sporothrix brasiliensis 5110 TaxID=1398154 RepID=A0A0C2J7I7_9PEZI|nr:cytokinesis regulator protein [Sporothrix brasiliensis 5110]KIH94965.1 cytokinesis regulator protein [Sporothrix brasiliensis 5110]
MEPLRLKPRQPVEHVVENWDDDDFMIDGDDITFRSSTNTAPLAPNSRRESHSSFRSDFESIHADEEQQVLLPGDDEKSTLDAIALATNAGIPLPTNVPPSALMGGTIKRLGGRKIKKIFQEDWGDDLELPDDPQPLHIKPQDGSQFPDVLRQVSGSSTQASPVKSAKPSPALIRPESVAPAPKTSSAASINLDQFRDSDDEDDFFGDGIATIKVPKTRQAPKPISMITPPTPQKSAGLDDDFEQDLELPSNGKLTLSKRKDIPKTPSNALDDFEWGEGSLGTRFGGTRRDGRSNRSSSVSALSPSVSSSITAESEGEDDTFDGLVLPTGPVNFGERLQKRRSSRSPQRSSKAAEELQPRQPSQTSSQPPAASAASAASALGIYQAKPREADKEDFLTGLDLGDGEVFDTNRMTLHRHVRLKETRPASPSRPKAAVSITFTNKPTTGASRLPRPMTHERTHTASSLEPVSESGGPIISLARRSQSRLGHSAQSSVSSIPTPSTPSSVQSMPPPSTPRRRELGQKTSTTSLRNEPTTTNAQLLRLKRSLPVMRQNPSPAPRPVTSRGGYERPPSRTDFGGRPQSAMRPKTPTDRMRPAVESSAAQARRNPMPFLPAGASQSQSHHVTSKSSRTFRRHDSDTAVDLRPSSRTVSRSTMQSPSPSKRNRYADKLTQDGSWQQLNKPRRQRQFGDGHELDAFDDLPTSSTAESRFLRQPASANPKLQLRNKMYQNILPDRTTTPSPLTVYSPTTRNDNLPHFARDTAASRIARETSIAQRMPSGSGPLAPLTTQRVAQLSTRNNYNAPIMPHLPRDTIRSKKTPRRVPQLKPHLISNLNGAKESKTVNGMFYNPVTMRWEGNENALSEFDPPASSPSTASIPPYLLREKENATPRPALITPIGATKGVQVVGGMVFDPQNMCWLKLGPQNNTQKEGDDSLDGFNGIDSDEDVFKDIPDLDDVADTTEAGTGRVSDVKDDWLVGEEFDVGPEFIRRQREEEQRWRKKCERWMAFEDRNQSSWRWLLQEMVTHPM